MAVADLRDELTCSICRDIYTDPVTLPCGHNFCRGCIGKTWDWQKSIEEDPSCPECRERYRRQPDLKRNLRLSNIAERFLPGNRKCSAHNEPLKYHCCEDGAPICASCCLAGGHRGHRVELLSEASEKKKEKLRKVLEKLSPEREETERGAQRLQERRGELEEKAAIETERVTALFREVGVHFSMYLSESVICSETTGVRISSCRCPLGKGHTYVLANMYLNKSGKVLVHPGHGKSVVMGQINWTCCVFS
uniref:Uncharacterized protein n=1 Tax=Xenopus tropicalis TaxID=8364 RepID=A0A803KE80_XENTR